MVSFYNDLLIYQSAGDDYLTAQWHEELDFSPVSVDIADLNGNSVPEIIIGGGIYQVSTSYVGIYEWNGYGFFRLNKITIRDHWRFEPFFAAGDVDGDGMSEIVVLTDTVIVYKMNGDNAYRQVAEFTGDWPIFPDPGLDGLSCLDLDGNGYAEIIISVYGGIGDRRSEIWEIDPDTAPGTPVCTPMPTPTSARPGVLSFKAQTVQNYYCEYMAFRMYMETVNPGPPRDVIRMILLESNGCYWFWPSWSEYPDVDYRRTTIETGIDYRLVVEFLWPETPAGEAVVWSLLWDAGDYELLCIHDWDFVFDEVFK